MSNIQLELLEELKGPDKMQVYPYGRRCWRDKILLEDIQNSWVIGLDDDAGSKRLNQMPDFFNNLHETCDLELRWPVILLGGGEEPRKKEKLLERAAARLTALRQIFISGGMKNNRS